jgi:16S rRNA (guanine527-N7)-methyltransferase
MAGASRSRGEPEALSVLARGAAGFGIDLCSAQIAAFQTYIETLLFWRARLSLTGATSESAIVHDHIIDSLSIARFIQAGQRVADLGSGAGFPGIPLAIAGPEAAIWLVESRRKRANFLREAIRQCKLDNVQVIEGRAESLPAESVGTFDIVVSRAVWTISDFLEMAKPLLRIGGQAVAMKGPRGLAESTSHPAFSQPHVVRYELHDGIERMLLVFEKRASA